MGAPTLDERGFWLDLQAALRAAAGLSGVDDSQIYLLEHVPEEDELLQLQAPALVLISGEWEPTFYCELGRASIPAIVLCIAETLDASDDADNMTDQNVGGLALRRKTIEALWTLGGAGVMDGRFQLTQVGALVSYMNDPRPAQSFRLRSQEGHSITVAPFATSWEVEWT